MDYEYDIMSAVDIYCNTKIDDLIPNMPNQTIESDILNDSQEMEQFLDIGGKKSKTRGKKKNPKVSEKKSTTEIAVKSSSGKKSGTTTRAQSSKIQTKPVDAEIRSDETDSSNCERVTQFESHSQRGKARRKYISELASRVPTVDNLDLTMEIPTRQSSIPTARSKRLNGRQKNIRQRSNSQQNAVQSRSNSNVICIGSDDEDAGVIYEPIKINNPESASTLNTSYSHLDIENPEYSIKIEWLNKIESFPLRKYQKFYDIFEILAKRENADIKDIVLNFDNKIIQPNDSPDSINYLNFDIISGRVVRNSLVAKLPAKVKKDKNQVCIKLQSNAWKRHISITIKKTDTFKILYIKCSEELKLPFDKFILQFDGENVSVHQTPKDLNFDDGEIIDCVVKK